MNDSDTLALTQQWLSSIVVDLQLCPFAKAPLRQDKIYYQISRVDSDEARIEEIVNECQRLDQQAVIETTLIIYPNNLADYFDYQQFIIWANRTLKQSGWQGVYQIATFHPGYYFANTEPQDRENYTNRAPFPIVHLLREDSLTSLIDKYPDVESIPENNIRTLSSLTEQELKRLFFYLTKD